MIDCLVRDKVLELVFLANGLLLEKNLFWLLAVEKNLLDLLIFLLLGQVTLYKDCLTRNKFIWVARFLHGS